MIRLTRKVFTDLSIWMIGLGLTMGIIFPFFVSWMGIPKEHAFRPMFIIACITAGVIVGGLNITLTRTVVGSRMKLLGERMHHVNEKFQAIKAGSDISTCNADECLIKVDSEDEIGFSAAAFNTLVDTLFQSIETEESLKAFTGLLGSQLAVHDLTEKALQQLMTHTGSSAGAILIEKDGSLEIATSLGIREVETLLTSDHVKSAVRNEKRIQLTLPEEVQIEGVMTQFRPQGVIIEPVLYKEVMLGLIILASSKDYNNATLNRLSLFGQSLALAMHNSLLFDRLERLAALDPLTGVYNRRFGMTRLHEEFGRTLRTNTPLGLMMIDFDHFKDINDVYGHMTGDRVLLRFTRVAQSVLREGDILVRYGGEEFLAILPGASAKDVTNIADRIRRKIAESSISDGEEVIKVTVSIGGASYPNIDVPNESELVARADKALYQAKDSGRNCVIIASGE